MLGVCTETSETKKGRQLGLWSEMWGWRGVAGCGGGGMSLVQ